MKPRAVILALVALLFIVSIAAAADGLVIPRQVLSGGGGSAESGQFAIHASIGQAVTGLKISAPFEVESGFWNGSVPKYKVYLPLTMRASP